MTEKALRQSVVEVAKKDLGAKQYSQRHADIIRDFNRIPGMGTWMSTDYAWCAASVSVWGWRAGLNDIYYPSASCNTMISLYKKHGRWVENDKHIPQTGDLIMYDWDDSGAGDNTGEADHVGLVISVANGFITVIEGNKHNAVGTRTLSIGGRYIRGFCCPDFKSVADPEEGNRRIDWAKALQTALNASYDLNLAVDGNVGPKTKQAIDHHYLWYTGRQKPIVNAHVSWFQSALNALGADLEVDGSFGPLTELALKRFQKTAGIDVDGYAGVQTHMALLRELSK